MLAFEQECIFGRFYRPLLRREVKVQISMPGRLYLEMVEHLRAGLPNEACGLLAGRAERDGGFSIEQVYPMRNAEPSPIFYRLDPKEQLSVLRDLEDKGLELAGIFHSHVASAAYPSPTDVQEAHYPDAAYVIVSLTAPDSPQVKAFSIEKKDWGDTTGVVNEINLILQ